VSNKKNNFEQNKNNAYKSLFSYKRGIKVYSAIKGEYKHTLSKKHPFCEALFAIPGFK